MHIYAPIECDEDSFVEFWSQRYQYAGDNLYDQNIGLELTEERIIDLFRWKNGTRLSQLKFDSVNRNYVQRRHELNQLNENYTAREFLNQFSEGGAIWRIFWLHCYSPNEFPIYDQHVHRAMTFLLDGAIVEIPANDPRKIEAYLDQYLPFYARFEDLDSRNVDKALWAFGKFINENNFLAPE